ncbi:LVIVD repeat-containing protein [Haloarchaeobius iranensis]|uniref:Uncharacterized conserved protein n=1 Tax=Haloarchaeobius iranensis TaxID=996166 RepID=A0A1G9XFB8_9EURY|nr:hypothetical protein [Haloarchaeobius iranensis]SDM95499.1 Uncharacterized conserved protein [Haloarchaeobius iranensis]
MERRDVLRAGAGALALGAVGGTVSAAGQQDAYEPLGSVDIEGTMEVAPTEDGQFAFVATGDGFVSVDISDEANPSIAFEDRDLLADRDAGPMQAVADVKVDGDRLLVVGPNQAGEVIKAALLYDISDPANPEQLAVQTVDHAIHNSIFVDGYAYLTKGDRFRIMDTSNDEFSAVSEWGIHQTADIWSEVNAAFRNVHDLWVQGDYAYLANWDAGTVIVDIADKANPSMVSRLGGADPQKLAQVQQQDLTSIFYQPPGNDHYVTVDENAETLYVGAESWDANPEDDRRGASGIDVWDISDKTSPEKLTTIHAPGAEDEGFQGQFTTSHNFALSRDRLYTSWYYGGVMIHDVSDPASPERIAWWRDPSNTQFWGAKYARSNGPDATGIFVAGNMGPGQDNTGGLYVFPDTDGEMAEPPGVFTPPEETSIVTSVDWPDYVDAESPNTQTPTETPTETPTATPTETPTATPTESGTTAMDGTTAGTTESGDDGGSPGFGAVTALAGLGLGAARFLRSNDGE